MSVSSTPENTKVVISSLGTLAAQLLRVGVVAPYPNCSVLVTNGANASLVHHLHELLQFHLHHVGMFEAAVI